jgi:hypothetical protein
MNKYFDEIPPVVKSQAEMAFEKGTTKEIVFSLLGTSMHSADWEWTEKWCLHFLESPVPEIRNTAIICLGHLARIHRRLHKTKVLNALSKYMSDPACSGQIEDAIEDIELFVEKEATSP